MNWELTDNKNWDSLEQQFRWVQDMNLVMQHYLHHEEGSVAVHTRMVLEALQQQPEYRALPAQEQEILWAAALLHDVKYNLLQYNTYREIRRYLETRIIFPPHRLKER